MKIVVLTSRFPYPIEKGDKLRAYHQIRELSQRHEIILCALSTTKVSSDAYDVIAQYCKKVYIFPISPIKSLAFISLTSFRRLPIQIGYFYRPSLIQKVQKIILQEAPDHVFCQLVRMAEYVKSLDLPKTLDYMDSFSLGMARRAAASPAWQKPFIRYESTLLKKYEQQIYSHFQYHTIISKKDRDHIQSFSPLNIHIIPNGVNTHFFQRTLLPDEVAHYEIAFTGNMGYFPNVHAAKFLIQEIMPIVWQSSPQVKVLLAGARPDPSVSALGMDARVTVSGWMEDIRMAYKSASIFVAPLFTGSGQQNKMLEAMSMELACVTTPHVKEAIQAQHYEKPPIVTAQNEAEFASYILHLLRRPEDVRTYGRVGRDWVKRFMSWEHAVSELEEMWAY